MELEAHEARRVDAMDEARAELKMLKAELAADASVFKSHGWERVKGVDGWTWKPPSGPRPDFETVDKLKARLADSFVREAEARGLRDAAVARVNQLEVWLLTLPERKP